MIKKFAFGVIGSAIVLLAALFALPTHAAPKNSHAADAQIFFAPTRAATDVSNTLESIAATRPGRCEVPILWWSLAQLKMERKCKKQQREVGTLELTPHLPRNGVMALLVEWRTLADGKLKFKCTGPISFVYSRDNWTPHTYSVNTKPGENLISANVFTYPYGWLGLERNATSVCIAR